MKLWMLILAIVVGLGSKFAGAAPFWSAMYGGGIFVLSLIASEIHSRLRKGIKKGNEETDAGEKDWTKMHM